MFLKSLLKKIMQQSKEKSRIPVLTKSSVSHKSLIPAPIKITGCAVAINKATKQTVATKPQTKTSLLKKTAKAGASALQSSKTSGNKIVSKSLTSSKSCVVTNTNSSKNNQLKSDLKSVTKGPVQFQKSLKHSLKSIPANDVERKLPYTNASSQRETYQRMEESKRLSRMKASQQLEKNKTQKNIKSSNQVRVLQSNIKKPIEKVEVIPMQEEEKENIDDNDLEFAASGFYKSLILSERELSPGIMKMCADSKFSSIVANKVVPQKNLVSNFDVDQFMEDVRRNSRNFFKRGGRKFTSSHMTYLNYPFKKGPLVSLKENLDSNRIDVKKTLEILKPDQFPVSSTCRRWTSNDFLSKSAFKNMNVAEIIRRTSQIRRESEFRISYKTPISENKHMPGFLNPHQRALKNIEALLSKKKEKTKKKVTFYFPPENSPEVVSKTNDFKVTKPGRTETNESSSQSSTPELDVTPLKSKTTFQRTVKTEDSSEETTPELNLKTNPNNCFAAVARNCEETATPISTIDLEKHFFGSCDKVLKDSKFCSEAKSTFSSNNLSSLKVLPTIQITSACDVQRDDKITPCKYADTLHSRKEVPNSLSLISKSMEKLTLFPQTSRETDEPISKTRKIFTPLPVSLYPKTHFSYTTSPSFLSDKCSTRSAAAPICTPFALKNLAHCSKIDFGSVRQKLHFNEETISNERRESQIMLQNIPTFQKMLDQLCDQECCMISLQSPSTRPPNRNAKNPIASILSEGDEMHFLTITSS